MLIRLQQQQPRLASSSRAGKEPPSAQDLLPILFGLLENADHVRRSAEDALDDIKSQYPDAALRGVTQIAVEGPEALRQFAMVLLRRMLSRTSCFFRARTGAETRSMVKSTLLTALEAGVQVRIRRAAVHCIVELAAALLFRTTRRLATGGSRARASRTIPASAGNRCAMSRFWV